MGGDFEIEGWGEFVNIGPLVSSCWLMEFVGLWVDWGGGGGRGGGRGLFIGHILLCR